MSDPKENASVPAKVRKPPFIPSAPVPAVGIMMVIGLSLPALAMDMWPDDAHVYTGYYYRKAVEPATYMKVLMICLVLGGFMEAVKCLYSAFFANGSGTRKAADLIGAVLFFFNIYTALTKILPREKAVGGLYLDSQVTELDVSQQAKELYTLHLTGIVCLLIILVTKIVSYVQQKRAAQKEKTE